MKQQSKTRQARGGKSGLYRCVHFLIARLLLWLFRVRIHGAELEPEQPYLLCCNHVSAVDPVLLGAALKKRQPYFMAKKELFRIPLLAQLLRALGAYPVDRSGDVGAIRTSIALLEDEKSVGIFPQGTRCKGLPLQKTASRLKNGAGLVCCKTQATVLPACIYTKGHRIRLLRRVHLIIGEPIPYEHWQCPDNPGHEEYVRVSKGIFDRICALEEDFLSHDQNN